MENYPQSLSERYQQLLWDRCCKIAKDPEHYPEPEYRIIRALRTQIIDLTQTLFPDIDTQNGMVDSRVRIHPQLQQMRGELIQALNQGDRVSRKLFQRYAHEYDLHHQAH